MGFFSSTKCVKCSSTITQNAPVSGKIGLDLGQKFAGGQISENEMLGFYKSLGAKCPSCSSKITYFV